MKAQSADTVVVYEYIYKTDTVWLEPKPARDTSEIHQLQSVDDATLIIDTINNKTELVIFLQGRSATIPINRILLNENHLKINKMKKVSFFAMFFLAVQSIAYAQPDISVKAGISQFWWRSPTTNESICIGDHEGIELKGPLALKNFSFSVGYEFHSYCNNSQSVSVKIDNEMVSSQADQVMETIRSFPVLIYYRFKRLELFAGYEYRLVKSDVSINQDNAKDYFFVGHRNEHSISTGLEFRINNRFSVYSKLCMAGVPNYNVNKLMKNGTSLDLSLKYYLYRNSSFANGKWFN